MKRDTGHGTRRRARLEQLPVDPGAGQPATTFESAAVAVLAVAVAALLLLLRLAQPPNTEILQESRKGRRQ